MNNNPRNDNNVGPVSQTGREHKLPERKHNHLKNFDYSDTNSVFFLTLCAFNKQSYFKQNEIAKIIIDEIDFRTTCSQEITVFAYCLMPDHLHLLVQLNEKYAKSLQNWIAAFKRYTSRQANKEFDIHPLWQKNFYEHIVRKEESLLKIAQYIVDNPARKELTDDWQKYPYSKINFKDL